MRNENWAEFIQTLNIQKSNEKKQKSNNEKNWREKNVGCPANRRQEKGGAASKKTHTCCFSLSTPFHPSIMIHHHNWPKCRHQHDHYHHSGRYIKKAVEEWYCVNIFTHTMEFLAHNFHLIIVIATIVIMITFILPHKRCYCSVKMI